jgi:hypothetical protein
MAFRYCGSIDGSEPILRRFVVKDEAVIARGAIVNLESGEVDLGATNDTGFLGVANETVDNTDDGETIEVITNPGAIYAVVDANARKAGDLLDIATGALGVTTSTNADLKVWCDSTASEPTQVIFNDNRAFKQA